MTTRRHTSARSDQPRSHRSQAKPAKAQPILLDRLDAALCRQGVVLKRALLQLVAAEAFGFHNANEFAAADLVPPPAKVLGRVEIDDDRGLIVVEDPSLHAIFGLDEGFFREALATSRSAQYGISPYGDLVDLSGLLADRRSGLPVAPTAAAMSYTPDPLHLYAGETIHFARIEIDAARPVLFVELTRKALDETIAGWCRENWAVGANPEVDPVTLKNANAVLLAYFAGDLADRLIYAQTKLSTPPQHLGGVSLTVWIAYHGDAETHRIYVDATEVGLHQQIRELLISLLEECDEEVDFDNDAELPDLIALYEQNSTMRIAFDTASISLPAGSTNVPLPHTAGRRHSATNLDWLQAVASGETTLGENDWLKAIDQETHAAVIKTTANTDEATSANQVGWGDTRSTQKVRNDLASGAASQEHYDHPIYRRADWKLETELGITKHPYAYWIKDRIQMEDASQHTWLKADRSPTVFSQRIARGCDVILQVPCLIDSPNPIIRKPGDLVRLRDWKITGPKSHGEITVEIAPGIFVMFRSEDRNGVFPVSVAEKGTMPKDRHPVYIYNDWISAHHQDRRVGQYETWLRNQITRNTLITENWIRCDSEQLLMGEQCRWIIHIHGLAKHRNTEGLPPRLIPFSPGDIVTVSAQGGSSGAQYYVELETEKGGIIRLQAEDRMGYLPISPVTSG